MFEVVELILLDDIKIKSCRTIMYGENLITIKAKDKYIYLNDKSFTKLSQKDQFFLGEDNGSRT